jgi:biopolymer transport protein ExbD
MAFTDTEGRTQTSLSEINVTPFVDVLLVLLVIFMLTAPILQSGIELDVPQTRTVREISQEKLGQDLQMLEAKDVEVKPVRPTLEDVFVRLTSLHERRKGH